MRRRSPSAWHGRPAASSEQGAGLEGEGGLEQQKTSQTRTDLLICAEQQRLRVAVLAGKANPPAIVQEAAAGQDCASLEQEQPAAAYAVSQLAISMHTPTCCCSMPRASCAAAAQHCQSERSWGQAGRWRCLQHHLVLLLNAFNFNAGGLLASTMHRLTWASKQLVRQSHARALGHRQNLEWCSRQSET